MECSRTHKVFCPNKAKQGHALRHRSQKSCSVYHFDAWAPASLDLTDFVFSMPLEMLCFKSLWRPSPQIPSSVKPQFGDPAVFGPVTQSRLWATNPTAPSRKSLGRMRPPTAFRHETSVRAHPGTSGGKRLNTPSEGHGRMQALARAAHATRYTTQTDRQTSKQTDRQTNTHTY